MTVVKLDDYERELGAVFGKKIAGVVGYPSAEFGTDTLVFKITRIVFDDGSSVWIEGEHDMAYVPNTEEVQEILAPHYKED